jgi:hypothetical protein
MSATFYLCAAALAVLNGTAAGLSARFKAYYLYVGIIGVAAFVVFLFLSLPFSGYVTPREVAANFFWAVPIPGLFGVSPGLLVRKGSTFICTFLVGVLTTVIATPILLFYGWVLSCAFTGDCLG